jgi:hypothetical protein
MSYAYTAVLMYCIQDRTVRLVKEAPATADLDRSGLTTLANMLRNVFVHNAQWEKATQRRPMALNLDARPGFDADVAANFSLRMWRASGRALLGSSVTIGRATRTLSIAHHKLMLAA